MSEQKELYQDVYSLSYEKTGIVREYQGLKEGEFFLSVHVWLVNSKGEILLQKRAASKKVKPNLWSVHGGKVDLGETSLEAAARETYEEVGLNLHVEQFIHLTSSKQADEWKFLNDVWLVVKDCSLSELKIQASEVSDVKWVSLKEFDEMIECYEVADNILFAYDLVKDYIIEHKA